jgi:hypothetical protein
MIKQLQEQMAKEAKTCSDCLGWHKWCQAECCKIAYLDINTEVLKEDHTFIDVRPSRKLSYSEILHYKYRDVPFVHGVLRFKKARITIIGEEMMYIWPCSRLKHDKCLDHPDKKPKICRDLTAETAKGIHAKYRTTPRCLFKFKGAQHV